MPSLVMNKNQSYPSFSCKQIEITWGRIIMANINSSSILEPKNSHHICLSISLATRKATRSETNPYICLYKVNCYSILASSRMSIKNVSLTMKSHFIIFSIFLLLFPSPLRIQHYTSTMY
jgi:hypothetical protein